MNVSIPLVLLHLGVGSKALPRYIYNIFLETLSLVEEVSDL